jgi:hypothetical protein
MPRTINQILDIDAGGDRTVIVPPEQPYRISLPAEGAGGGGGNGLPHRYVADIAYTLQNASALALIYIYEGMERPTVTDEQMEAARVAAEADDATEEATDAYTFLKVVKDIGTNWARYSNWFLVLVACTQVRKLDTGNLSQFCNMSDARQMPAKVLTFLRYFAAQLPSLIEEERIRVDFSGYPYFEYHTSASSTPQLVDKAMLEVTGLGFFSEEEEGVVEAAMESKHDLELAREIDPNTLVKARAILEANGTLPDVWYMGARAVDRFSGKKYSAMVKLFKALFNIQSNTDNLEDLDEPALVGRIRHLLNTVEAGGGGADDAGDSESEGNEEEP